MGILKLRNADVEQRIGLAKSKKKSTSARLIFRVNIPRSDGSLQTLQVASTPIICSKLHCNNLLSPTTPTPQNFDNQQMAVILTNINFFTAGKSITV